MRHRRFLTASALAMTGAVLLAGCTGGGGSAEIKDKSADFGFNEEGLPIVDDTLTLTFGGTKAPLAPEYSEMELVQQWEEDTNIAITWENLPDQVYAEKKNLMLASGDLPDVLFNTGLTDAEIVQNGSNGTLLPLEEPDRASTPPPSPRSSMSGPTSGPRSPRRTGTSTRCRRWKSWASCSTPTSCTSTPPGSAHWGFRCPPPSTSTAMRSRHSRRRTRTATVRLTRSRSRSAPTRSAPTPTTSSRRSADSRRTTTTGSSVTTQSSSPPTPTTTRRASPPCATGTPTA